MKIFTRKLFIFLFAIVFCSCSDSTSGPEVVSNVLVDSRDSQTYKTIEIGGRVWMAENLNYQEKQGRLYLWNEAMVACPNGWELPSKADFDNLIASVGGFENAADSLISCGFITSIQGGYYFMGYYSFFDEYAYFWTSDEVRKNNARSVMFEKGRSSVSYDETFVEFGLSVRCVKK